MSTESKLVKYSCLLALVVGVAGIIAFIYAVATGADLLDSALVFAAALDSALFGFNGARAANVPSQIVDFKKQVQWSPIFCVFVAADFSFLDMPSNVILAVVAYASLVTTALMTAASVHAANKIKQA